MSKPHGQGAVDGPNNVTNRVGALEVVCRIRANWNLSQYNT
jgi:hypothetical protein